MMTHNYSIIKSCLKYIRINKTRRVEYYSNNNSFVLDQVICYIVVVIVVRAQCVRVMCLLYSNVVSVVYLPCVRVRVGGVLTYNISG